MVNAADSEGQISSIPVILHVMYNTDTCDIDFIVQGDKISFSQFDIWCFRLNTMSSKQLFNITINTLHRTEFTNNNEQVIQ